MKNRRLRKAWGVLLLAVVACIAVGVLLSTRGGLAQVPTTVRIGSGSAEMGDSVTVRLEVLDVPAPGLGSYVVDVSYNPAIVDPTGCVPDPNNVIGADQPCNLDWERNDINPDKIRVGGFHTTAGLTGTVALADITFQVVGPGVSDLTLNVVELAGTNAADIPHGVQNGSITGSDTITITPTPPTPTFTPTRTPTPGTPGPGATVRIGSGTADVGDSVTVRLEVLNVPPPGLGAYTIDVSYDPAIVDPTGCAPDPNNVIGADQPCNLNWERNDVNPDTIRIGGFQTSAGLTGTVALADITFQVVGAGCSDLTLSVVELTDTSAANIPRGVQNGSICSDGGEDVVVAVEPPQKNAYIANGQFTVDVEVNDVTNLGAFEFTVDFDPAVIGFVSFTEGPFLSSTGRNTFCTPFDSGPGSKNYACASGSAQPTPAPGPSGSGVLATITFSPLAAGASPVDLHDVILADPFGTPIAASAEDGQVNVSTLYGDMDGDCRITILDVQAVFAHWPSPPRPYDAKYDMNGDGKITIIDVQLVFNQWPKPDMCP